jgi:CubicO group peptidase (beta-lactamase class C family)
MATGLECRDSWKYRWRGMERMMQTDDWVQYVLDLPMIERPGTRFEYCNGASFLLSAIIQETSGMTTAEFAEVHLFASLGIDDVIWPDNPQGITLGYGEMRLQPHDMAKIGHLYLKDGQWDSNEIIPASWLAASTFDQIRTGRGGYGYQWWIDPDGVYNALGYAGQYILVVPEIDLVAVFTGNLNEDDSTLPRLLLDIFVIRAAKSSEALPANPDGVGLLESSIQAAASAPAEPEPAAPLPEVARRISGTTYLLDTPNPSGLASISLSFGKGAEALMKLAYVPEDTLMNGEESPVPVQAEVTLGLDNVYRFSPGFFGMKMGAKGE